MSEDSPLCVLEAGHDRFVLTNGLRNRSSGIGGKRGHPTLGEITLVGSEDWPLRRKSLRLALARSTALSENGKKLERLTLGGPPIGSSGTKPRSTSPACWIKYGQLAALSAVSSDIVLGQGDSRRQLPLWACFDDTDRTGQDGSVVKYLVSPLTCTLRTEYLQLGQQAEG
jgi:hypothetical protein